MSYYGSDWWSGGSGPSVDGGLSSFWSDLGQNSGPWFANGLFNNAISEIRPGLYLGSIEGRFSVPKLDIKTVVCVISPAEYGKGNWRFFEYDEDEMDVDDCDRIQEIHYPLYDDATEDILSIVKKALPTIQTSLTSKRSVLVHCAAGISRSASVVIAYLMKTEGLSFNDAKQEVKKKRPIINPNPGFSAQLENWNGQ